MAPRAAPQMLVASRNMCTTEEPAKPRMQIMCEVIVSKSTWPPDARARAPWGGVNFWGRLGRHRDPPRPRVLATYLSSLGVVSLLFAVFPAGFGWQAASVVAGQNGFEADTLNFALTTGAGDFVGVFIGHGSYSIMNAALGRGGGIGSDLTAGLQLATAAFCSGTAWQPTVNFLHDSAHCNFVQTFVGTGAVTGFCFFVGLRLGRFIYKARAAHNKPGPPTLASRHARSPPACRALTRFGAPRRPPCPPQPLGAPAMNYGNLCDDALLSVSIGAATGTFVGTDITFADNVIRPFFGVEDSMSDIEGMVRAGLSTSAGFLGMQTAQNLTLPRGANWIDPVKV